MINDVDKCKCSVKIENLSVKRGNKIILNNISFDVNHGEIMALIGKNGSGKTTLLKALIKSIPYSGSISFFDKQGKKILNPKIGYIPQTLTFDKNTPLTILDLFCSNKNTLPVWIGHTKAQKERIKTILKKVGIELDINKKIGSLSGGELQRMLLAFALEPMPDILLLDEPISAVDRKGTSLFYKLITSMRHEYHMPIVLVSHDLGHVKKFATTVALIKQKIATIKPANKILEDKSIIETFGLDIDGSDL